MLRKIRFSDCLLALFGSMLLGFGLYEIHTFSGVTEGGQLGLTLLLQHWFSISPAFSSFVLNAICYLLGWRVLGKRFVFFSAISTLGFSLTFRICEQFPPLWPDLAAQPLLAAIVGALFVGVSTGLCVRVGGAPCGDDALAMVLSRKLKVNIEWMYLFSDFTILALSLTYIPLRRILFSVLTVTISSLLVGVVQRLPGRRPAIPENS